VLFEDQLIRVPAQVDSVKLMNEPELASMLFIWNPDTLDKMLQNSTYVSEHNTNMYTHVH
jgi:hypothetical protein